MTYKVITLFTVKTKAGDLTLNPGQVITLADEKATKLITEGKIEPIGDPKQQQEPQITGYELSERMAIMGENTEPDQVLPFVTDSGVLVIPFNSPEKYHYWKKGGQSVCTTLKEIGRCDLIERYKSFYCN